MRASVFGNYMIYIIWTLGERKMHKFSKWSFSAGYLVIPNRCTYLLRFANAVSAHPHYNHTLADEMNWYGNKYRERERERERESRYCPVIT
jgi:hypothetical protein